MTPQPCRPPARFARALAIVFFGAFAAVALAATPAPAPGAGMAPVTRDPIARGAYLAQAGDCVACHTQPGGKPLAGGRYIDTPFGAIASPNITPDRKTGIGNWSDEAFWRVMHDGIGHRGEYLYPVMPFPWYTIVTREDVMAIKAFLFAQPAVEQPRAPDKLSFPFNVRASLGAWRAVFFEPKTFVPDAKASDEVNRGAYLVNGLAHCGECHNSRPVAGTSRFRGALQGGVIDGWYAPNISSDLRDGIGSWSREDIARFLKTGAAPGKGVAAGPMAEAVHSLSALSDADLLAIAAYLKTTPPKADTEAERKLKLFAGRDARGGGAYLDYCASCHGLDGKGLPGVVPALDRNGAVSAQGPQNVIQVVVGGLPARGTLAPMPAIGAAMSDQEVADVANYVRQSWGNAAPATAEAGMVAQARGRADAPMTAVGPLACPGVAAPNLARAIDAGRITGAFADMPEAEMPRRAGEAVSRLHAALPRADRAQLVNGLADHYCRMLQADASLAAPEKALRLGRFSQLLYSAASGNRLR